MKKLAVLFLCFCLIGCSSKSDDFIYGPKTVYFNDLSLHIPDGWMYYQMTDYSADIRKIDSERSNVSLNLLVSQVEGEVLDWSDDLLLMNVEAGWDIPEVKEVGESEILTTDNGTSVAHIFVKWENGDNWETFFFTLKDYTIRANFISDNIKGYDYYQEAIDIILSIKREF